MQGCGSVLATQNLDTISYEYSTQQRSSSSQHFVKPRLIARPVSLPNIHQPETAEQGFCQESDDDQSESAAHQHRKDCAGHDAGQCCRQRNWQPNGQYSWQPNGQPNGQPRGQPGHDGRLNGHNDSAHAFHPAGTGINSSGVPSSCRAEDEYNDKAASSDDDTCCIADSPEGLPDGTSHAPSATDHMSSSSECQALHACQGTDRGACSTESERIGEEALTHWLEQLHLRYFTPREVANLHSFPSSFSFPPHVTVKQQYALLGNSLSVAVVADLLTYLLTG